jgi:hypothetical protein
MTQPYQDLQLPHTTPGDPLEMSSAPPATDMTGDAVSKLLRPRHYTLGCTAAGVLCVCMFTEQGSAMADVTEPG